MFKIIRFVFIPPNYQRFVFYFQGESFIQAAGQDLVIYQDTRKINGAHPFTTAFRYKGRVVTKVKPVFGSAVWKPSDGEFSKWRESHQGSIEVAVVGSTKIVVLAFLVYWQYIGRQIT